MPISDVAIDEKIESIIAEPEKYKVIFLNDDRTPMEWVIEILVKLFKHSESTAKQIMLQIHNEGSGVAGTYTYEIAEQKVVETINSSRDRGFPLQATMDKE